MIKHLSTKNAVSRGVAGREISRKCVEQPAIVCLSGLGIYSALMINSNLKVGVLENVTKPKRRVP
jgi:hypothetical protein